MRLRVESDGGSRGNPGIAGSGCSVVDAASAARGEPHELACQWEYIDKATNNVAEYKGLINGLTLAREVAERSGSTGGETTVDVFMDSKLIVEQMTGRWKIKHPDMKPLAQQVKQLEREFSAVTYTWVPRERNKRADALTNLAMDEQESGVTLNLSDQYEGQGGSEGSDVASRKGGTNEKGEKEHQHCGGTSAFSAPDWHGGTRPTRFLLVRHGQTEMSVAKQFSGLSDPQLTETGQWQAAQVARYLGARGGIQAVVSSPLTRTQQTAQAIADQLGLSVTTDEGLIEMDFGTWEGRSFQEIRAEYPDEHREFFLNATSAPPGGESQEDVYHRMEFVINRLVTEYEGANVVLVSHVTPIKSVIRLALQASGVVFRTMHLDLAGLSIVEFYPDDTSVVRRVNDTHYLEN
ncbi:bifunctional RNase H/acid phosphatase [Corynebacterium anserum]|uniref:Bifunctional RNase H/acid phosphatase n=1 Tax=Corynebacterium anserum TaxID=2684406 RepID=A0A7G7YMS6_9CORY|nr:bifunctional RNase H/acid phosphatase [Corynebacterium anserum]QNH95796.1 bifunctional RNase H/acid phosphatase [Corynebacterium anserum]